MKRYLERDPMNAFVAERPVDSRLTQDDLRMQREVHGEWDSKKGDPAEEWGEIVGAGPSEALGAGAIQMPAVDTPPQEIYDREMIQFSTGLASERGTKRKRKFIF